MTTTPPKFPEVGLGDSWIELSNSALRSPERITPLPFSSGEEYLRLLREAQRESNQSSRVVSLANSRKATPGGSPKSPPNSPNTELCTEIELQGIYINNLAKENEFIHTKDTEWLCDWNSRPDQLPPKSWKFEHPKRRIPGCSITAARVGNNSLFSREVIYSLLITNVLSLLVGAGFGVWFSRRGFFFTRVSID